MRIPRQAAAAAAAAGLVVGGAALAGAVLDPVREPSAGADGPGHGSAAMAPAGHAGAELPPGLAVSDGDLRLHLERTTLPRGQPATLAFRILDAHGEAVTDMEVEHERRMHLIVVRRDLTGYQHLHPRLDRSGRWTVAVRLPRAGVHRVVADFRRAGASHTLAADVSVPGGFAPRALPPPGPTAQDADGYRADLAVSGAVAGGTAELTYALSRDGRPLRDLQPYLGADGHLVALREGDLAFLHVHPREGGAPGRIAFGAELPSPGRYRLFLQFRHGDAVRTLAHTLEVSR